MVSVKSILTVLLQYLLISILTSKEVLGRTLTGICPVTSSSQTDDLTWLLHGSPPKCYAASSQGPCEPTEVLIPKNPNSYHGVCVPSPLSIIPQMNSGARERRDVYGSWNYALPRHVTKNSCKRGWCYSHKQGRCTQCNFTAAQWF
ncbi:unnamed protein product [Orchesella dallaii]|uniref:Secreted protein n=1 Tax=Orchesella dallaii TaxID=48710 RepID=A0ABP1PR71_9HEXA